MDESLGKAWPNDFMDRKPSSEFLKKYLLDNPQIKVLNVNSPWGSGKSFFLENWHNDLKLAHPCIFFNAWETDYSSEPLVALVTAVEQGTEVLTKTLEAEAKAKAIDVGSALIKSAVPLIAKGLFKKFLGANFDEVVEGAGDDAADSTEEMVKALIKEQSKSKDNVKGFKKCVSDRLEDYSMANGLSLPAFIFIDELDRCRPTYAIELLERIKHFFDLQDCRFVIASDSVELAHSIRAIYGQGFSSERYLSRFFDAEYRLDNSNIYAMARGCEAPPNITPLGICINGICSWKKAPAARADTMICMDEKYPEYAIILAGLARFFAVQIRELKRYAQQIKSMASSLPDHGLHYFWAAFLIFAKSSDNELYRDLLLGDKYETSLNGFKIKKGVEVSFVFNEQIVSIEDIASIYLQAMHSNHESMRRLLSHNEIWIRELANNIYSSRKEIASYKNLIELAHRLG
jgi:hypothetical protein